MMKSSSWKSSLLILVSDTSHLSSIQSLCIYFLFVVQLWHESSSIDPPFLLFRSSSIFLQMRLCSSPILPRFPSVLFAFFLQRRPYREQSRCRTTCRSFSHLPLVYLDRKNISFYLLSPLPSATCLFLLWKIWLACLYYGLFFCLENNSGKICFIQNNKSIKEKELHAIGYF